MAAPGAHRRQTIYLAGPDVFLPDAEAILEAKCRIVEAAGFSGLSPLAGDTPADAMGIFRKCEAAMDRADLALANMTPFRGPGMDPGTAYEVGYMRAQGKPVFGYSNAPGFYRDRAANARQTESGLWDACGVSVEDFGLPENLMLAGAASASGLSIFTPDEAPADPDRDLATFERAVAAIRELFSSSVLRDC